MLPQVRSRSPDRDSCEVAMWFQVTQTEQRVTAGIRQSHDNSQFRCLRRWYARVKRDVQRMSLKAWVPRDPPPAAFSRRS